MAYPLIVAGVPIPVAVGDPKGSQNDNVDRSRSFDNSMKASQAGTTKQAWDFSTPPISRSAFRFYKALLSLVPPHTCWGEILGGGENIALQSENFGTTWAVVGTPTRVPASAAFDGIVVDRLGDDAAGTLEGYTQPVTFTGDGQKGVSVVVYPGTSTSSVIRLADTSPANRIFAVLTWSAGLPFLTMFTGTYLGYDTVEDPAGAIAYRLLFSAASVTAANSNHIQVYPATDSVLAAAGTGDLLIGGVQVENGSVPTDYEKTTTATVNTFTTSCYSEVTGWTPIKTGGAHRVVLHFALYEA